MRLTKSNIILYIELLAVFCVLRTDGFVKYLAFGLYILFFGIKYRVHINRNKLVLMYPSLFFCAWGVILASINGNLSYAFKEVCFVMIPVIGAYVLSSSLKKEKLNNYIDIMFLAISTVFLIYGIREFTVSDLMESTYAFIFGIFVLYYFYNKSFKFLIPSLVFTVLADKRIVWGAVLICIIAITLLDRRKNNKFDYYKKAKKTFGCISLITILGLLFFLYMCSSGLIEAIMYKYGINSMGRLNTWHFFSKYYSFSPLYFGHGIGSVQKYIYEFGSDYFARLHNDILMFYIELGFFGFVLYIYSQFDVIIKLIKRKVLNYKKSIIIAAMTGYTLVCCCTDNISIYISYLFPLYLIMYNISFGMEERQSGFAVKCRETVNNMESE